MDIEKIRELRLAHPFKPFALVLKDGRRLPVERAYYLGISPDRRAILLSMDEGYEIIGPDRVIELAFHQEPERRAEAS